MVGGIVGGERGRLLWWIFEFGKVDMRKREAYWDDRFGAHSSSWKKRERGERVLSHASSDRIEILTNFITDVVEHP